MWQFSVSFLTVCVSLWSFCISLWLSCLWMRSFFICLVILHFYTALQYLHVFFFFCLIVVVLCPFSLPSHPLPITGNPVGGNCGENDIFITSLLSIGVLYSLVYHWYEFTYILSNLTTQISTDMKRDRWMKYKPTYFQCATSLCDPQGRWVALNISRIVWHIVSQLTAHPPLSDLRRKKKLWCFSSYHCLVSQWSRLSFEGMETSANTMLSVQAWLMTCSYWYSLLHVVWPL